jgi:transketolase|tara:strand:- start:333 stop:959 length:627 start_codon:yes stop_codon:yes gene_type:complete
LDKQLVKRILDISYKNKCSHIGSYLSAVGIIDDIFKKKNQDDIFILSSGHAAIALYCVIEKYYGKDAEKLFKKHGGHPHRDEKNHIYCSTGSLGMGVTVAVGRALANPNKKVYVLLSDGECAEGSVWESLRFIKEQNIENIEVYVNANGYAAYDSIDVNYLEKRLKSFLPSVNVIRTKVNQFSFLNGLNAHYHVMSKDDYKEVVEGLR